MSSARQQWVRVEVDKHRGGYSSLTLRASTAERLRRVLGRVRAVGGIITSSGGRRGLSAAVGASRSATSLHYTGRALDLYLYSGMVDPTTDPYVITDDGDRLWRVWARTSAGGARRTLLGETYTGKQVEVSGHFVDLTAMLQGEAFGRVPARSSFARRAPGRRQDGAAEWWHFQDESGLVLRESTFGEDLLQVWTPRQLEGSPPWQHRGHVWRGKGYGP